METDQITSYWPWREFCERYGDTKCSANGYYATSESVPDIFDDYHLCLQEAEAGNKRAQQYIAKFRLLGGFDGFA